MVQKPVKNHAMRGNHQHYARMTHPNPHRHVVPTTVLTRSRVVPLNAARPVTTVVPPTKVHHQRPIAHGVPKAHTPSRRPINLRPSPTHDDIAAEETLQIQRLIHMNKLVKGNLVRGLPSKVFENNHTCVACKKGKQHRASCKTKPNETSTILKTFITGIENQLNIKVKIIRSNNGTEFKNQDLNQFCRMKGINKEFSVARTPQQNEIAERKNRTLIEAGRTMLADSLLPIPFWAEAVNTACYVQNRVLVTKPHNKTPYDLLLGRTHSIGFMRPFGCPVTILNTLDPLGKFVGKVDEGFLVGYYVSSKAFRVFNSRTRIIQETLHINFLENQPNVAGSGPTWLFDIDTLTQSMNYQLVVVGNQPNSSAGIQEHFDADKAGEGNVQQYVLFPLWSSGSKDPSNTDANTTFVVKEPESEVYVSPSSSAKTKKHVNKNKREAKGKCPVKLSTGVRNLSEEFEDFTSNSTNEVNAASTPVPVVEPNSTNNTNTFCTAGPSNNVVSSNFEIGGNIHLWILLNTLMILICLIWKTLIIQMMKKMLV
nr:hypothetical protein [Tanacetum cinerariifolium]